MSTSSRKRVLESDGAHTSETIDAYFGQLCKEFGFSLPFGNIESPSKRRKSPGHEAVSKVRFLFFKDFSLLNRVREELRNTSPEVRTLDFLLEKLNDAFKSATLDAPLYKALPSLPNTTYRGLGNVSTEEIRTAMPVPASHYLAYDPPSPTLAIKHLPQIANNKSFNTSFGTTSFLSVATSKSTQGDTPATSFYSTDADQPIAERSKKPDRQAPSPGLLADDTPGIVAGREANQPYRLPCGVDGPAEKPREAIEPSPTKIQNYRVRRIPSDGLVQLKLPDSMSKLPFDLRVEAHRVMHACGFSTNEFEVRWSLPRDWKSLHVLVADQKFFRRGRKTDFTESTLCSTLRWSGLKHGPLFSFEVHPPRKEKPSSFQRKFGGHRILVVQVPDLSRPPHGLASGDVQQGLCEMLSQQQEFLGRQWKQFHIQQKKRQQTGDPDSTAESTYQLFFIALTGDGLEKLSIAQVMNWAVPFRYNSHQPACKAFARLDLATSRTTSTVVFDRDQLKVGVVDQLATTLKHNNIFNDPSLAFTDSYDSETVMSDGCCEISTMAMDIVRKVIGLTLIPSVVQARIFGAKGVWYHANPTLNYDPSPADKWIKIAKSQIKAKQGLDTDSELLTLNVVDWSRPARASLLYPGFLRILEDRGVPKEALLDIARRQVQIDTESYLSSLNDSSLLLRWVHEKKDLIGTRIRNSGISKAARFPSRPEERLCQFLESGFKATECKRVAEEVQRMGELVFKLEAKSFQIKLPQSTSLIGIADPTGTLEPGEICANFSEPLHDPFTGQMWSSLPPGQAALVARNPSERNSDIQKVRIVHRPELAHFYDVVIFSALGSRPLAGMLSGGDYDGDKFWVTWDPTLVDPFRNAPAPWKLSPPEDFGIRKDTVTLGDIVKVPQSDEEPYNDEEVVRWIARSTAARMEFSLLGVVTLTLADLKYAENDISSTNATHLIDLHDHLVDADKQGFRYSRQEWLHFKKSKGIRSDLPPPAHRLFTRRPAKDVDSTDTPTFNPRKDDIVDQVFFDVVKPGIDAAMAKARALLRKAGSLDDDLVAIHKQVSQSAAKGSQIYQELQTLRKALDPIKDAWARGMRVYHRKGKNNADWLECVESCRNLYDSVTPEDVTNATVIEWLRPQGRDPFTFWEKLKASTLAQYQHGGDGKMMFAIAGEELCRLKAHASHPVRQLIEPIYLRMKPQKAQRFEEEAAPTYDDADSDDDDDLTRALSEFHENDSIFDPVSPPRSPSSAKQTRSRTPVGFGKRRKSAA